MYKIETIKERDLKNYTGKIIQVIERHKYAVSKYDPFTGTTSSYLYGEEYELVCLVEY